MILDRPEARQLYHSIIEYMKSDEFFDKLGIKKGKM